MAGRGASFGGGRPAAALAWRPGAPPPGRAPLPRGCLRRAIGAALGIPASCLPPLAILASELTLGATAYRMGAVGGPCLRSRGEASARLGGLAPSKSNAKQ